MSKKQELRRGQEKNRPDVESQQDQTQANRYRQILQKATETSPFRSLTTRRERAGRVRLLNENRA